VKAVDSLQHANKKLPAAEGACCRQMRVEDFGAHRRASNVPCPKTRRAQYQHPTRKSNFLRVGYPNVQNICHKKGSVASPRNRVVEGLFDITRSASQSGLPVRWGGLLAVGVVGWDFCNRLIYLPIPDFGCVGTIFPPEGLPRGADSLFI
jgi:hypothetical protein